MVVGRQSHHNPLLMVAAPLSHHSHPAMVVVSAMVVAVVAHLVVSGRTRQTAAAGTGRRWAARPTCRPPTARQATTTHRVPPLNLTEPGTTVITSGRTRGTIVIIEIVRREMIVTEIEAR